MKWRPLSGALPAGFNYAGSHNPYSVAAYVRARLGLAGPAVAVSSACSSSAKVFASAWRMLTAGLIDAAVVGGVAGAAGPAAAGVGAFVEVVLDDLAQKVAGLGSVCGGVGGGKAHGAILGGCPGWGLRTETGVRTSGNTEDALSCHPCGCLVRYVPAGAR